MIARPSQQQNNTQKDGKGLQLPSRVKPNYGVMVQPEISQNIELSKKIHTLTLTSKNLINFPVEICSIKSLKLLNLGFNNIETIPLEIANLRKLKKLFLNDNPIQAVPIEISECKYLRVLDLSNTYVKRLPREVCFMKGLYDLNLVGCPLDEDIAEVYPLGIVKVMQFYRNLMDRAVYRVIKLKKLHFFNFCSPF